MLPASIHREAGEGSVGGTTSAEHACHMGRSSGGLFEDWDGG